MSGLRLNHQLTDLGATMLAATKTAPIYRERAAGRGGESGSTGEHHDLNIAHTRSRPAVARRAPACLSTSACCRRSHAAHRDTLHTFACCCTHSRAAAHAHLLLPTLDSHAAQPHPRARNPQACTASAACAPRSSASRPPRLLAPPLRWRYGRCPSTRSGEWRTGAGMAVQRFCALLCSTMCTPPDKVSALCPRQLQGCLLSSAPLAPHTTPSGQTAAALVTTTHTHTTQFTHTTHTPTQCLPARRRQGAAGAGRRAAGRRQCGEGLCGRVLRRGGRTRHQRARRLARLPRGAAGGGVRRPVGACVRSGRCILPLDLLLGNRCACARRAAAQPLRDAAWQRRARPPRRITPVPCYSCLVNSCDSCRRLWTHAAGGGAPPPPVGS